LLSFFDQIWSRFSQPPGWVFTFFPSHVPLLFVPVYRFLCSFPILQPPVLRHLLQGSLICPVFLFGSFSTKSPLRIPPNPLLLLSWSDRPISATFPSAGFFFGGTTCYVRFFRLLLSTRLPSSSPVPHFFRFGCIADFTLHFPFAVSRGVGSPPTSSSSLFGAFPLFFSFPTFFALCCPRPVALAILTSFC